MAIRGAVAPILQGPGRPVASPSLVSEQIKCLLLQSPHNALPVALGRAEALGWKKQG